MIATTLRHFITALTHITPQTRKDPARRRSRASRGTESLESRQLLTMMNLDLLKADAFALSKAAFQREVVAAAGVLDFPADSKIGRGSK